MSDDVLSPTNVTGASQSTTSPSAILIHWILSFGIAPLGGLNGSKYKLLIFLSSKFREIFQKTEHLEEKLHQ